ncbi:MAG: preprotein translocase subunit SecE [bacterium]|nr:preprotein translocase subunit SecE [bacterium]MCY3925476.1 preprotein translocase subunit SecE [bacterium]
MNRQFRRMARKQGAIDEEGAPVTERRQPAPRRERASPAQFMREVRAELRKVSWPTRAEVVNYSIVTLVVVIILTAFIGALDYGFGEAILKLFER